MSLTLLFIELKKPLFVSLISLFSAILSKINQHFFQKML